MTTTTTTQLLTIDAATLQQWLTDERALLVDVREPVEFAGEHLPGAQRLSLSRFEPTQLPEQGDRHIVLYCQTGERSRQAAQKLLAAGIAPVHQLAGGLEAWRRAGYPTQVNDHAPISIMRQVQIVAGSLVLTGTLLGALVSPWFLLLSGFVGTGLTFAGLSGTCTLGLLLARLPYNQRG
ncbi:MAG: rhodanese-like domain-containing protein [Spirulinaceae cyanobacterium SM2_1_0]|nr:rhodanese-like domain-containing protein [Spirulinaceae cyanobacterium SM2_1_0]